MMSAQKKRAPSEAFSEGSNEPAETDASANEAPVSAEQSPAESVEAETSIVADREDAARLQAMLADAFKRQSDIPLERAVPLPETSPEPEEADEEVVAPPAAAESTSRQMDRPDSQKPAWAVDPYLRGVGTGASAVPDGKRRGCRQRPAGDSALADRWHCRGCRQHAEVGGQWILAPTCFRSPIRVPIARHWMRPTVHSALRSTSAGSSRAN